MKSMAQIQLFISKIKFVKMHLIFQLIKINRKAVKRNVREHLLKKNNVTK